jgi:hypothetical protein
MRKLTKGDIEMSNGTIKSGLDAATPSLNGDVELLDNELDEVSGGACGTFTCGLYRVANAQRD